MKRAMILAAAVAVATVALGQRSARADKASAHYHKAMAYKRGGNHDAAIRELKQALIARENYAAAHYSIGILYRKKGSHGLAISHLERAARLDEKNAQIHYSLGLAYHRAGRKDQALSALERAAELNPKDAQVLAQVGVLYIRKDPSKAIEYLKKAVKAKPNNADHVHQLGLAYRKATTRMTGPANDAKRKRYLKDAEKWLRKAASMKEDANIEFDLAVVYRRLEKAEKAIEHYENAVRLNPRMAPAYWDLAHMYAQARRSDDAIRAYRKYISVGGKDRAIANKRIKELRKK